MCPIIADGLQLSQNEVYGSALVKAYKLETKEAGYPRIIVGESLWKYINYVKSLKSKTEYGTRAIKIAKQCKSYVVEDYDQKYILDVIGKAANSSITSINPELVKEGYHHIVTFQLDCKQKRDKKLASRYQLLENYFKPRLSLWGIKRYEKSHISS